MFSKRSCTIVLSASVGEQKMNNQKGKEWKRRVIYRPGDGKGQFEHDAD